MLRFALLIAAIVVARSASAEPVNVLMIAVDDLGNVLHSAGHPVVKTPNLDRLAATGVRFDRAYCQIPLCNPSRSSLLTGLRPDATRVYDLERHFREELPGVTTLPQLFRKHGWFTARVGKLFHYNVPAGIGTNGLDDEPSWDERLNPRGRDVAEESLITNPTPGKTLGASLSWLAADGDDSEQTDGQVASATINLLESHRTKPFFIAAGFYRPHTPYVAPKKYFDLYPVDSLQLPNAPAQDRVDIPQAAFAQNNREPNYGLNIATCRQALQAYYASVTFMDAQVGRLLDAVDRLELADRTVIVLWSDHGYHLGEHGGLWQKRTLFEESARAPLIIRAPRAAGNGIACDQIVEFVDIYPTVAGLCGLASPKNVAGRSLQPLLEKPRQSWDGVAVTQILRPADAVLAKPVMGRSIRTDRWRYTEWDEGRAGRELYDHSSDPHEFQNLAESSSAAAVIPALREKLQSRASGTAPPSPFVMERL